MGVQFVNTTREEFLSKKYIYKFLPLENALLTFENEALWFANPAEWKDPFEKRFINANYQTAAGKTKPFTWKDRVFCICMTKVSSSEAYWNTYSSSTIGIELKINRAKLLELLEKYSTEHPSTKVFIGEVEYEKTSDITKPLSEIPFKPELINSNPNSQYFKARLLLLKRVAYTYESEFRFIVVKETKTAEKGIQIEYKSLFENTDLVESITIDPRAGLATARMLKVYFAAKYNFVPHVVNGKNVSRVLRSTLYKTNNPVTILP